MEYQRQYFADGEVLNASHLNHMEEGIQASITERKGNMLYTNALKGTASGVMFRLDDVSPLEHGVKLNVSGVGDLTAVTVYQLGKNLCPQANITTKQDYSGRIFLKKDKYPWLMKSGVTYTLSADVTVYEDDTTNVRFFDLTVYYTDGTYVFGRIGIKDVEALRDGVTRHYSISCKSNPEKEIAQIVLVPLSYSGDSSMVRNAKAENIQLELSATETAYEPYTGPVIYPVNEDGACEVVSRPNTTISTDTVDVVMDCEYNRDINKAFEQLTQAIISMGGNI